MEAAIGGTRRHLVDVALGQRAAGLDVHVCASALRAPAFRADLARLAERGVGVHELAMVREIRPARDLAHARALVRLLERVRPAIVHTHSSKAGALGRSASAWTGIGRRVHTPHTFAFLFGAMFSRRKRALFRAVERRLGARTERMVAVSRGEAETIAASGVIPAERVRVVRNGIDPAPFAAARPVPRASLGVPEGAPLAAVVGLLNSAKGQDLALEALARPACARLHVLLAGEGEDEPALRARAKQLGVEERAHFLGWRDDVPGLLASCDFLILPSRWEGMPYIVLEAFASARPVVATRVDGARELVEEGRTGTLAEVGDARSLGEALERMLLQDSAQRARMGERGRALVQTELSAESMVRGLIAVYSELA